ncbi:hypothetical protein [Streptomyces sp. NPDC002159]
MAARPAQAWSAPAGRPPGFPSHDLYTAAAETRAELLWRASAAFALPIRKRLADGRCLSELRDTKRAGRVTVQVIE